MSAPNLSAGIVAWRRAADGTIQVLLGHLGGPFFTRRDAGAWTIPKGLLEDGEDARAAATREFTEETGATLPHQVNPADLGEVRSRGGKRVRAFALEIDLDPATLSANTFELEWPRGSGVTRRFPELDRFGWFPLADASRLAVSGQSELFDRLADHLGP